MSNRFEEWHKANRMSADRGAGQGSFDFDGGGTLDLVEQTLGNESVSGFIFELHIYERVRVVSGAAQALGSSAAAPARGKVLLSLGCRVPFTPSCFLGDVNGDGLQELGLYRKGELHIFSGRK